MASDEILKDIVCEVSMRYRDVQVLPGGSDKLTDIYLIMEGEKNTTRKILLNAFELRTKNSEAFKEMFFEFYCKDIGKIQKLNVSIENDDRPNNCLYIDFIEVTIKDKSAAFKFPVERSLGSFIGDGKFELDLEVWKHPERKTPIVYNVLIESVSSVEISKNQILIYLVIYGENSNKTAKLILNDGKFEKSTLDKFSFNVPEIGRINKLEVFYLTSNCQTATWHVENIEIKIESKNEAYMFPVHCIFDKNLNHLELKPWTKPTLTHYTQNTQ